MTNIRTPYLVSYGAIFFSLISILLCILIMPMVQNRLEIVKNRASEQMLRFRFRSDKAYQDLLAMSQTFRSKREEWGQSSDEGRSFGAIIDGQQEETGILNILANPHRNIHSKSRDFKLKSDRRPNDDPFYFPKSDGAAAVLQLPDSQPTGHGPAPGQRTFPHRVPRPGDEAYLPPQPPAPPPPPEYVASKPTDIYPTPGYGRTSTVNVPQTQVYQSPAPPWQPTPTVPGYQVIVTATTAAPMICPPGPPGQTGEPGMDGLNGMAGKDGAPGVPGTDVTPKVIERNECTMCPAGRPGSPGPIGPIGPPGKKGVVGPAGYPGKIGPDGKDGPPGLNDKRGPKGKPGQKGPPGPDVSSGKGLKGTKGQPGGPGAPGLPGLTGKTPAVGYIQPGPSGQPGQDGQLGLPGQQGPKGAKGNAGQPGVDAGYCKCPSQPPATRPRRDVPYAIPPLETVSSSSTLETLPTTNALITVVTEAGTTIIIPESAPTTPYPPETTTQIVITETIPPTSAANTEVPVPLPPDFTESQSGAPPNPYGGGPETQAPTFDTSPTPATTTATSFSPPTPSFCELNPELCETRPPTTSGFSATSSGGSEPNLCDLDPSLCADTGGTTPVNAGTSAPPTESEPSVCDLDPSLCATTSSSPKVTKKGGKTRRKRQRKAHLRRKVIKISSEELKD